MLIRSAASPHVFFFYLICGQFITLGRGAFSFSAGHVIKVSCLICEVVATFAFSCPVYKHLMKNKSAAERHVSPNPRVFASFQNDYSIVKASEAFLSSKPGIS